MTVNIAVFSFLLFAPMILNHQRSKEYADDFTESIVWELIARIALYE